MNNEKRFPVRVNDSHLINVDLTSTDVLHSKKILKKNKNCSLLAEIHFIYPERGIGGISKITSLKKNAERSLEINDKVLSITDLFYEKLKKDLKKKIKDIPKNELYLWRFGNNDYWVVQIAPYFLQDIEVEIHNELPSHPIDKVHEYA